MRAIYIISITLEMICSAVLLANRPHVTWLLCFKIKNISNRSMPLYVYNIRRLLTDMYGEGRKQSRLAENNANHTPDISIIGTGKLFYQSSINQSIIKHNKVKIKYICLYR